MKITLQTLAMAGTIFLGPLYQGDLCSAEPRCSGADGASTATLGDSRGCLACHDGTIAKSAFPTGARESNYAPKGNHPVLVTYERAHLGNPRAFVAPAALDPKLQLVEGKVQCVTCHTISSNQGWTTVSLVGKRDLCLGCHKK
jgi:hypothetical protein